MNSTTRSKKFLDTICFALGIVLIALIIQLMQWAKGDTVVFPGCGDIIRALISLLSAGSTYEHLSRTMIDFLIGVSIGGVLGLLLGFFGGLSKVFRALIKPLMITLRSLPTIVLIVILMVIAKYVHVPVLASAIVIIPFIYEATATGIETLDKSYLDVYRLESSLSLRVIFFVHIPLISGYLRQAFSNAIGMGIKICVISEYIAGVNNTVGKDIMNSRIQIEFANLYAYAIIMVFLVLAVEAVPLFLTKND